ncbi:NUC130/3NT domain/SDA1, putative [Angomonas deanei]|uniref:Protein SDA1 n=1 Tax=Angomonas deanei TaxID=59799 RepID=A0A7G2CRJ6_9TRYP|nr:NUC130/3NT domain/SDA1, putative [Angomonas deanei]
MTDANFKGTLLLLQNRTRRDPESYKEEFLAQLEHFIASSASILTHPTPNPQYLAVLNYVCHVSHCFPKESRKVADIVLELLCSSKGNSLRTELRHALLKCLMLLRSKGIVTPEETFPILFTLLQERDKPTRKMILTHIVGDIRRNNMPGAKNGAAINKKMQNFLFSVMAEDDPIQARCAEVVMIDLYRRRVWCDERTVEVLTQACFSKHTPILRTALRFFLLQMPKISSIDDTVDTEEVDPGRDISKMKQKLKIVKKTSKRERILQRNMKSVRRKYNKEEKEEEAFAKQHVDPIRLLRDPNGFVERLLARLRKTSERFEVRLLYLNVIARVVSEHEVVHLPLYSFLERYMEPSQLHSTQLLALSSMCVHRMTPPDAVEPLVKTIANHFVTDRSTPDAITVGINTIREICKRQPLAMTEDLLKDLVEYKNHRGDKGVIMSARALLQLYREVYPDLLPAKLRGTKAGPSDAEKPVFGATKVHTDIPGLDLLYQAMENSQSDSSSDDSDEEDSDSDSGEWVIDSDADPDAVDGDFVDVSDDGSEEEADNDDEPPQLVPVDRSDRKPTKKAKLEDGAVETAVESDSDAEASEEDEELDSDLDDEELEEGEEEEGEEEELEEDEDEESSFELEEGEEFEEEELEEGEEEEDEDEEEESGEEASSTGEEGDGDEEWVEDMLGVAGESTKASSVRSSNATNKSAISHTRLLTDEDFKKIRKLQAQGGSHLSLRGKQKVREEYSKRKHELIHGISNDLSAHDIEQFTIKRKETDKQEKIEQAREVRKNRSKFEIQKKKKTKLNSTHGEHSKRGKLFNMTKRSQRVATKLKSSVMDRSKRAKDMKKKDIKFRIKRGWKA